MKSRFNFLSADILIQCIFFFLYILSILSMLFQPGSFLAIFILHFFVGIWQLVSCVIHISKGDGLIRKNYFLSVLFYFLLIGFFGTFDLNRLSPNSDDLFIIGIGALPMGLAIWYFIITTRAYKESKKNDVPPYSSTPEFKNQILDENIWE